MLKSVTFDRCHIAFIVGHTVLSYQSTIKSIFHRLGFASAFTSGRTFGHVPQ